MANSVVEVVLGVEMPEQKVGASAAKVISYTYPVNIKRTVQVLKVGREVE